MDRAKPWERFAILFGMGEVNDEEMRDVTNGNKLRKLSHPKTSEKILSLLDDDFKGKKVVDLGAGTGAFTSVLFDRIEKMGSDPRAVLSACDYFPESYHFSDIECQKVDFAERLPFDDESIDTVISIEVIEHLRDQFHFVEEIARITRPGGRAFITTPNILNANGRVRYLLSGTWPLFDILPIKAHDISSVGGHIGPVSLYFLYYFAMRAGFRECRFHIDKVKRSALVMAPFIFAANRLLTQGMEKNRRHFFEGTAYEENLPATRAMNSFQTLVGRTIIVEAIK